VGGPFHQTSFSAACDGPGHPDMSANTKNRQTITINKTMFCPNQKITCINDSFPPDIRDYFNALPVKGNMYTVRDIVPGTTWKLKEEPAVYLVELVNMPNAHGIEPGFACRRFAEPEDVIEEMETEQHWEEYATK